MKSLAALPLILALAGCAPRRGLPVYGQVPPFQLTDQAGRAFDGSALEGRVWVADFIFTSCTGPCPRMSALMRQVQSSLAGVPDVRLVSFTVDPDRDTPRVLAEYAQRYRAESGRWFFLTGERRMLDALDRQAFKLGNVDGTLSHSTRFTLVDRRGRIRGYYGTSEESPAAAVVRDVRALLRETS